MGARNFPKTLGAIADRFIKLRNEIAEANKVVSDLKAEREDLKAHFFKMAARERTTVARGKRAQVKKTKRSTYAPNKDKWNDIYEFMFEHKDPTLLQKRLNQDTVKDYFEDGEPVPGVDLFEFDDVSVSEIKGGK